MFQYLVVNYSRPLPAQPDQSSWPGRRLIPILRET